MYPIEVLPIRTRIAADLRNALLSGEFQPGRELNLTEIANLFNVSRTPVREAFMALAAEGLLELRMNKGAVVVDIDEKFIRDHYEMRQLLEGEAVARVTRMQPDISDLLDLQKEAESSIHVMTKAAYANYNQQLHTSIWQLANNAKLRQYLSELWNGPSTGRFQNQADHQHISILEHRVILNYIQDGDAQAARKAMEEHVTVGMNNMINSRFVEK